jgi:transcriptional regulator with XRE-family HTH domain
MRYPNGVPVRFTFDARKLQADLDRRVITVAELAALAGLTRNTIHNFIAGRFQSKATNNKICKALGYPRTRYVKESDRGPR